MLVVLLLVPGADTSAATPKLKLNRKKVTITVGDAYKLKFNKSVASVKWTSSDKNIATVSKKGLVRARSEGAVTITAKALKKTYKCVVTVKNPEPPTPQDTESPTPQDTEPPTPQETSFNPDDYRSRTHLRTSLNPWNYVDVSIDGTTLTVSGKLTLDRLSDIWVMLDGVGSPVPCTSGELFRETFDLAGVTDEAPIIIYTHVLPDTLYWGYIWHGLYVMNDSGQYILKQSPVLENNLKIEDAWVDPQNYLRQDNEEITNLAKSIVGDETDPYRQLWLINEWVAENIYYNRDYYYGRSDDIVYNTEGILDSRTSVCEGYSNIMVDLIRSVGIPCMKVSTFSTGVSTKGYFDETNSATTKTNHAHVEAYLASEDRWVAMDATWDSSNKYENGEYKYQKPRFLYFDASPDFLALSHKIINRPK